MGAEVTTVQQALPQPEFWSGRRVLLTGHTGFKGSWLAAWLVELGAHVLGLSLPEAVSTPSLWQELALDEVHDGRGDVTTDGWQERVERFQPSVVFHLAAQPLVSAGWQAPLATFDVNVLGTARVLELAGRMSEVEAVVIITTDKVYASAGLSPYTEAQPLGGDDPYSASKAAAELLVRSWPAGPQRATARAGNVIGGGDWAQDRLLPDLLRAWVAGAEPVLRHPDGVRPWQHVLEPLRGYLVLAEALANTDTGRGCVPAAINFGPGVQQHVSVRELVSFAAEVWRAAAPAPAAASWSIGATPSYPETQLLTLDSALAAQALGWRGLLDWRQAVRLTLHWHLDRAAGRAARDLVAEQLQAYTSLVRAA